MVTNEEPAAETQAAPEKPEVKVDDATEALVKQWLADIKAAHKKHEPAFKKMRKSIDLAADGTTVPKDAEDADGKGQYVVPITNRLINHAVSTLYAKNPKAVAKRKEKLYYKLWDGDPQTLMAAFAKVTQAAQMQQQAQMQADQAAVTGAPPPMGHNGGPPMVDVSAEVAMLEEVQAAKQEMLMLDRMAKTMELLFAYFLDEQDCGYKEQLKAWVRRAKVCSVAYIELGFQRTLRPNEDVNAQIPDITSQIATIEGMMASMADRPDDYAKESAKAAELRLLLEDLQSKTEIVVREGPVLSFPSSMEVWPDAECRHLKTFAGARFIVRELEMSAERVMETYKVDIKGNFTEYKPEKKDGEDDKDKTCSAKLYRVWDKKNQQSFVVCDGYPDFIVPPSAPDVKIDRFWPIFALVFNESEGRLYPNSDAWNVRHMQREYNSGRQGLREHRIAARPGWAVAMGKLEEADRQKLANKAPFEVLELKSMTPGEKVADMLQPLPLQGIDPGMYETESAFQDIQRSVGVSETNLGGTGGDTATEASIAENSRATSNDSDKDDLDGVLSALARAMGQLLLQEMSADKVTEIVGPGAVWPTLTKEQVTKDLLLDVEAGSSGRPNQAAELAKFERAAPWAVQFPEMNPRVLVKKVLKLLDIPPEDGIVEGLPSITALNQMAGRPPQQAGDGQNAPDQQGDKGGDNAAQPAGNEQQSQPGYPAPMEATPPTS